MLTRLGRNYKSQAKQGIAASARLEQAREDRERALDEAEEASRKSNMATGAGMGLANAGKISGALGLGKTAAVQTAASPVLAPTSGAAIAETLALENAAAGGVAAASSGAAGGGAAAAGGVTSAATPALGASMAVPVVGLGVGLLAAALFSDLF